MSKLKLGALADDKPVKLAVELPAAVHRDLLTYAEVLAQRNGTGDWRTGKADSAHVGAVYGDRSRICKTPSCKSSTVDWKRIALSNSVRIADPADACDAAFELGTTYAVRRGSSHECAPGSNIPSRDCAQDPGGVKRLALTPG